MSRRRLLGLRWFAVITMVSAWRTSFSQVGCVQGTDDRCGPGGRNERERFLGYVGLVADIHLKIFLSERRHFV